MIKPILVITSAAAAATAALAQAPQRSAAGAGPNVGHDMNEVVCRSQAAIGSRLNRQRVCATRQQWLEQQRMDRLYAEKAQTTRVRP